MHYELGQNLVFPTSGRNLNMFHMRPPLPQYFQPLKNVDRKIASDRKRWSEGIFW